MYIDKIDVYFFFNNISCTFCEINNNVHLNNPWTQTKMNLLIEQLTIIYNQENFPGLHPLGHRGHYPIAKRTINLNK